MKKKGIEEIRFFIAHPDDDRHTRYIVTMKEAVIRLFIPPTTAKLNALIS